MSTLKDTRLTTLEAPDRLWYAEGVLLDAEDLWTEQTYHRGRLARALAWLHGGGTAAGLKVTVELRSAAWELRVSPGLAVDRLGRLIESPEARCLDLLSWWSAERADGVGRGALRAAWFASSAALEAPHVVLDVFVRFVPDARGKTPAYATGPYDALDAVQPSRVRDGVEFSLVLRPDAYDEQGRPRGLPESGWPAATSSTKFYEWAGRLQDQILDQGWQNDWVEGQPPAQPEHRLGQDTSTLFLARILLPVSEPDADLAPTPSWSAAVVDNRARRFAYTTSAFSSFFSQGRAL